ncbi:MAG: hypothetical protein KDA25_08525 [Phycisphaerales bacterium]|nr:hypothetical protein [Phycisphaerales bacterium]
MKWFIKKDESFALGTASMAVALLSLLLAWWFGPFGIASACIGIGIALAGVVVGCLKKRHGLVFSILGVIINGVVAFIIGGTYVGR